MTIASIFEPEQLIVDKLTALFSADMVFTEDESHKLDESFFSDIPVEADRVACLVLNAGFRADPPVGNSRKPQQRLKMLWQIVIVCPKSLRKSHGGVKFMEVIATVTGWRPSKDIAGNMRLVDDERSFNRPDYGVGLVYLPMMYTLETIV